jgi:excisionase family DNA binding protein
MEKELFSTAEAAQYLGIKEQTLRLWRKTGEVNLPLIRIGEKLIKYSRKDLDAYIESRREQAN